MRVLSSDGKGQGLISYFTRHGTIANLLLVVMITLGIAASGKIRSQFFPDVVIESISVNVAWTGAGPAELDSAVVELITPALLAVEGVESVSSTAREGSARISMSFDPGWNMDRALDDVKAAVDGVRNLPEGVEDPSIVRGAWRDKVTDVLISGPVSVAQLGRFADEFSAKLYQAGITKTTIQGLAAQTIRVSVPELALFRNDINLRTIAGAITDQIGTNPAGDVAGGSSRVRTGVDNRTPDGISQIIIRSDGAGANLLVQDIAEVTVDSADSGRALYSGDNPAVLIRVDRGNEGDAIAMQTIVENVAATFQEVLPQGSTVKLVNARSKQITDRLNILVDNGLMGLGLVLLMLYLFLGLRTAFWVAAGIPVAMFAAIALMYAFGLTLNIMSLFALIITLGIVVDDAIVVGEHADYRARHLGESPTQAAENAASRMAAPVFSSTITTVLAFFGLVLIGGRFGSLIADIPFTVIVVLMASLMECFLILPNHMRHSIASGIKKHWYDFPNRMIDAGFRWVRATLFMPFMRLVIWLRYPVLAGMVYLLVFSASMFIRGDVSWRFFSSPEQGTINANIAMLPGATREDTLEMVREAQRAVEAVADAFEAEHGIAAVTHVLAQVGGTTGRGLSGQETKEPDQLGSINIGLIDADLRPFSSSAFVSALQDEVRSLPLMETLSFRGFRSGPGGDALDVSLSGADAQTLKAAAEALKARLSLFPEVSALEDSLAYDKTELVLQLTPLGTALGFTTDGIGSDLRDQLNGIEAANFPDGLRSGQIIVQIAAGDISSDFINQTRMRSPTGEYVVLSDIVSVDTTLGFSTVQRENGVRLIKVNGDISEDDPVRAEEIIETLNTEILPEVAVQFGVEWELGGLSAQESEFLSDAMLAFGLCMLGIYLTLSWIFASWTLPFVVMVIIPFGLVGTIWGHYIWGVPLSMYTVIGLIGMSGIVINDSIVLVTTYQERLQKKSTRAAILETVNNRLRPLMLTTLTTVLGLAPLLYETSQQAQFLKPTVITLCYGLGFGFVIVLLAVPSLLVVQNDIAKLWHTLFRALRGGRGLPKRLHSGVILTVLALLAVNIATVGALVVQGEMLEPARRFSELLPIKSDGLQALATATTVSAIVLLIAAPFLLVLGRQGKID